MKNIIEVKDISRHYFVGKQIVKAIDSISVDIKKNEYVSFMGASGSGKSTLMNIIGCLDSPTGGNYKLNDKDVSNMSESDIEAMLDNTEMIGYGEQFLEITVDVNNGDCVNPFFETNDDGEDVTYTWELISLEYEINAID